MAILDAKARDLPSDNDFLFVLSPRSKIHLRILLSQETMITRMAAGFNGDISRTSKSGDQARRSASSSCAERTQMRLPQQS